MICNRQHGGSARDCACRHVNGEGWDECPTVTPSRDELELIRQVRSGAFPDWEITRKGLRALAAMSPKLVPTLTGDICQTCGSPNMIRTGTCLTCQNCGDASAGCS